MFMSRPPTGVKPRTSTNILVPSVSAFVYYVHLIARLGAERLLKTPAIVR